jgi:YkoY family integral membrane protein
MDWTYNILGPDPAAGILVVLVLILIEGVLSVDNAAVLATMVMGLPAEQRGKALKYGIIGAYAFRGICLVLAAWLIRIWWLEPVGGLYLLYIAWKHFANNESSEEQAAEAAAAEGNWLYRHTIGRLGPFWATVVAVEVMDLAFSLDNVLAAVTYVKNFPMPSQLVLVCVGVFLGILAMRFAAQGFVTLMHRYPFLDTCAFVVIGILGVKLLLSIPRHFVPAGNWVHDFLASKYFDLGTSVLTLLIFIVPVVVHRAKNRAPLD